MLAMGTATHEVWLRPNRRALLMAMIVPALLTGLGGCLWSWGGAMQWLGAAMIGLGAAIALILAAQCLRPRLAVRDGRLFVYLRLAAPLSVPLDVVECVFLGRPEMQAMAGRRTRMSSLVIRLAEAAVEYKEREVKPALGRWADGYITIHGAWCEHLTLDLAQRLNNKLRDAQREHVPHEQP
jgi:hypothetical protein